ncbi:N/A [soil metagenome]
MASLSITIQIIGLIVAFVFMFMLFRLIVKGRLREEYSIIWIVCTIILIIFSIWRRGLEQISLLLGVYYPPSLIFIAAIFAIIAFLVHLSVVNSKLQNQIKTLAQEIAYLKQQMAQQQKLTQLTIDMDTLRKKA